MAERWLQKEALHGAAHGALMTHPGHTSSREVSRSEPFEQLQTSLGIQPGGEWDGVHRLLTLPGFGGFLWQV